MQHINPYIDYSNNFDINPALSSRFKLLNEIESAVPKLVSNDFHMEMFLNRSVDKIIDYNKSFLNGSSELLESLGSLISKSELKNIKEHLKTAISILETSILNEQAVPAVDPKSMDVKDWDNAMKNIESTTDIPQAVTGKLGVLGILKNLWNALTEDGSAIGVFHFMLDILGLVGDGIMMFTGIPVGIAADMLNGIIYAYRAMNGDKSKWILAIISLVAATIPLYGDVFKGLAKGSKAGAQMMEISTVYFSKETVKAGKLTGDVASGVFTTSGKISEDAVKLAQKASPDAIKAMNYTANATKKAVPLIRDMVAKFFDGFLAAVVGWVPLLGTPLKKFFTGIGKVIRGFSKGASKFADDIPKIIKAADLAKIDTFFATASRSQSKIFVEGSDLVVKAGGKIEKIPAHLLTSKNVLAKRFGGPLTKDMEALLKASDMNIAAFYKSMAENMKYMKTNVYGKVFKIGRFIIASKRAWTIFLGKSIYKMITGFDPLKMGVSDGEVESIGISSFQKMAKDLQRQEMAKDHKIKYPIPILDSDNPDHAKVWNGAQQSYADMMGLPSMESAIYYQNKEKDVWPEGLKEFMEGSLEDQMPEIEKMSTLDNGLNMLSVKESKRYVMNLNDFIKNNK